MKCIKCGHSDERPVVAVDIDGTLADYHRHFFTFAAQWLGAPHPIIRHWLRYDGSMELSDWMQIDKRTYQEVKLAYRQGGMKRSMPLMHGATGLMDLLRTLDVDLWITTTRPYLRLDNIDPDTREWLRRNEFYYDHLMYDDDKYFELANQVGKERIAFVLDDLVENCQRAEDLGIPAYLAQSSYNAAAHHGRAFGSLQAATRAVPLLLQQWKDKK